MSRIVKSVSLTPEQENFIKGNGLELSKEVQNYLNSKIKEDSGTSKPKCVICNTDLDEKMVNENGKYNFISDSFRLYPVCRDHNSIGFLSLIRKKESEKHEKEVQSSAARKALSSYVA